MQGIVGQASDFVEVVSKIDWTLLHEIWWRKIEKIKGDWRATLWYSGFHFLCSFFRTVADSRSFVLKLCGLLEKIRHGLPSSPISKKSEKKISFFANSLWSVPPFAGAFWGCKNVTYAQFSADFPRPSCWTKALRLSHRTVKRIVDGFTFTLTVGGFATVNGTDNLT